MEFMPGIKENETVWVTCESLKKEVKLKKKSLIPGIGDETKIDYNIVVDVPVDKLKNAPPSGPNAPKNKWRKL